MFFGATQQAEGIELARFADSVRRDLGDQAADLVGGRFASREAALRFFAVDKPLLILWGRTGAEESVTRDGVLAFSAQDILEA